MVICGTISGKLETARSNIAAIAPGGTWGWGSTLTIAPVRHRGLGCRLGAPLPVVEHVAGATARRALELHEGRVGLALA
eukprot:scaffold70500_cov27-Phaeocystis_antarctica.AAC.1